MGPTVIIVVIVGALLVGLVLLLVLRRAGASRYQDMEAPLSAETPSQFARGEDLPPELVYDVRVLMEAGRKIDAIRRVREVTHWGLKEANDYVESLEVPTEAARYSGNVPYANVPRRAATHGDVPAEVLGQVQDLLARRQKIEAIKLVRETTNWGLKDAKDYVDRLEVSGEPASSGNVYANTLRIPTSQTEISPEVLRRVHDLVARRQKIEAIKVVREVTNWGLKEAKDFVEGL